MNGLVEIISGVLKNALVLSLVLAFTTMELPRAAHANPESSTSDSSLPLVVDTDDQPGAGGIGHANSAGHCLTSHFWERPADHIVDFPGASYSLQFEGPSKDYLRRPPLDPPRNSS